MSIHPRTAFVPLAAAFATALSFSAAAASGPAEAPAGTPQDPAGQPPAEVQPPAAVQGEVSDRKLKQFAEAAAEVQKIQQDYAAKAQTLQKATEEQIVASVQQAGMTVAEFTALVERVQTDPTLARRLDGMQVEAQ